ncbi:MAG TPA: hypothetical protein VMV69_26070 [Pirellulales bacterium]|nr:hypothetical protein [Pirellulales bacterium]
MTPAEKPAACRGLLFESPVSWYAGKGWNLSPGYERVNQRFDRRIEDQCIMLEVNPWLADEQSRQAEALWAAEEFERTIERAEAALKVDPALVATRSWLVKAYRKIGDEAAGQRHAEIVRRMK